MGIKEKMEFNNLLKLSTFHYFKCIKTNLIKANHGIISILKYKHTLIKATSQPLIKMQTHNKYLRSIHLTLKTQFLMKRSQLPEN